MHKYYTKWNTCMYTNTRLSTSRFHMDFTSINHLFINKRRYLSKCSEDSEYNSQFKQENSSGRLGVSWSFKLPDWSFLVLHTFWLDVTAPSYFLSGSSWSFTLPDWRFLVLHISWLDVAAPSYFLIGGLWSFTFLMICFARNRLLYISMDMSICFCADCLSFCTS